MTEELSPTETERLMRYVPRIAAEWDLDAPGSKFQRVFGTLCFVDISGFTPLTERLGRRGRIGAEQLTDVLDSTFGSMLDLAYERGGSLLKFGGDALLLLFVAGDHPLQAVSAAIEMQADLRKTSRSRPELGSIQLRMSAGVASGPIDLYDVGDSHREMMVTGRTATEVVELEGAADAGEILVSRAVVDALPPDAVKGPKGPGWLIRWRKARGDHPGPIYRREQRPTEVYRRIPAALRSHLAAESGESEHRMSTVGFVKFKGIQEALDAGGHGEAAARLDELMCVVQREADREGVTFLNADVEEDGGKITLITGVPVTQTDDEGRMLRACRRILDSGCRLDIRVGVNRGHVFAGYIGTEFRSSYTVMGDTINSAARITGAAPVGGLYATPAAIDRSMTLFETTELEPLVLKGMKEPMPAFACGAARGSRPDHPDDSLRFTGRVGELAAVEGAVAALQAGYGGLVAISGEAGMGKTRLLDEALADLPGATKVTIRGEPNGADNAYWAFRDPLRDFLGIERRSQDEMREHLHEAVTNIEPDLLPVLPLLGDIVQITVPDTGATAHIEPRFRPERAADALIDLLEAAVDGGFVLIAEDHHWIDEASRALIDRLGAETEQRPWLVMMTSRESMRALTGPTASITLAPLGAEEAKAIAVAATEARPLRPAELDEIVRRAGGNPLFLSEILRHVRDTGSAEDLPESLDAVVGSEIDSLPPLPRQLLRYASVLGRSFREVVLDELLAPEDLALDDATRRTLARYLERDGDERIRFRHEVTQGVAYGSLSYRRRRLLHERAAEAIERLAGEDRDAVAQFLSLHYYHANRWPEAWRYSRIAGDRAKAVYANQEAAAVYERALRAVRFVPDAVADERVEVLISLGDVFEQAGYFEEALGSYRRASRLIEDDPLARADLQLRRARVREREGAYSQALREVTTGYRAVESIDSRDACAARARLSALGSTVLFANERFRRAIELAESAVKEAERSGELAALARAYGVLDLSHRWLGEGTKSDHAEQMLEIYEDLDDLAGEAVLNGNLGAEAYFDGRWSDALELYERSRSAFVRLGNDVQAALAAAGMGELLANQLRVDEAEPLLMESLRVLRASGFSDGASFAEVQLGRVYVLRGEHEEAREILEHARDEFITLGEASSALEASIELASSYVRSDEPEAALAILDEAEHGAGGDARVFAASIARMRAEALKASGQLDAAGEYVARGLDEARSQNIPYEEALLLRIKQEIASESGAPADDADRARADRIFEQLGVG